MRTILNPNKSNCMSETHATILFPYEPEELWSKIREIIRLELQGLKTKQSTNEVSYEVPGMVQKPIYKAREVCTMLQISRQTLHAWVREGILKPYKIKSRVFFLWSDLEKLLTPKE